MRAHHAENRGFWRGALNVQPMQELQNSEHVMRTFSPPNSQVGKPYFHKLGNPVVFKDKDTMEIVVTVRLQCSESWVDPMHYPLDSAGDVDLSQMPHVIRSATGMCTLSAPLGGFVRFEGGELRYYRAVIVSPDTTISDMRRWIGEAEGWNREDISVVTDPETNVEYGPHCNVFDVLKDMTTLDKQIFAMRFDVPGENA